MKLPCKNKSTELLQKTNNKIRSTTSCDPHPSTNALHLIHHQYHAHTFPPKKKIVLCSCRRRNIASPVQVACCATKAWTVTSVTRPPYALPSTGRLALSLTAHRTPHTHNNLRENNTNNKPSCCLQQQHPTFNEFCLIYPPLIPLPQLKQFLYSRSLSLSPSSAILHPLQVALSTQQQTLFSFAAIKTKKERLYMQSLHYVKPPPPYPTCIFFVIRALRTYERHTNSNNKTTTKKTPTGCFPPRYTPNTPLSFF